MDTVHECLRLLSGSLCRSIAHSLAACCDKLGYSPVGKEHELLDQPVGLFRNLLIYIYRTSCLIDLDLHFRTVEADGSCCKSLLAKLACKAVQYQDCVLYLFGNTFVGHLRPCLDDGLSLFICKSEIRVDHRLAEPLVHDAAKRSHLEYR